MTDRIDAHHHLWRYRSEQFDWISDEMVHLRRDFLPEDLEPLVHAAQIDGTVAVQSRQTLEETYWLLQLAAERSWMRGVVGWAPIASPGFPTLLDELRTYRGLKGLRHIIQDEPDDNFILGEAFDAGIATLRGTGLVYDILIHERHLPQTIRFVDRHPDQVFVLDHLAKPRIRAGEYEPWATGIRELARRGHVFCKVSGMVTEADPRHWSPADLEPYWQTALEAFGPRRILVGSDWPVCELASAYTRWFDVVRQWTGQLSTAEQDAILGGNAITVYRLGE